MSATLGFHLLPGAGPADVVRAARGAPSVKVCDAAAIAVARAAGASFVYYRPYLPDDGDCTDGAAWGDAVWQALEQAGGARPDALCFRNECSASTQTAQQYLAFRNTLRALGYGGLAVLGSFSVGTPDWPQWAALRRGLAGARPDAIDLHEYWSLSIDGSAPWFALRHREALRRDLLPGLDAEDGPWPIFIGECGSDAVGTEDSQGRRGWNDNGKLTAAAEMDNLLTYRRRCAASVRTCFVFADGGVDSQWTSYRTFDTPLEAGVRATWAAPAVGIAPAGALSGKRRERHVTVLDAIPELRQGATRLCWAECVQEAFAGAGYSVSVYDLYKQVKGLDYAPPGEAASFSELTSCVQAAATLTGGRVRWFGSDGKVNDLPTFDQLLRDGSWVVIVGVDEQTLVDELGLHENAGYGHYFLCRHLDFDGNGVPETDTIDSYRAYDHIPERVPLAAIHDAMARNWDANYDALAFQVG